MNPLELLNGYRTLIGALGSAALGVYLLTQGEIDKGVAALSAAFIAFGLGQKLDKNTEAVKDVVSEVKTVATEVQSGAEEAAARSAPAKRGK